MDCPVNSCILRKMSYLLYFYNRLPLLWHSTEKRTVHMSLCFIVSCHSPLANFDFCSFQNDDTVRALRCESNIVQMLKLCLAALRYFVAVAAFNSDTFAYHLSIICPANVS